MTVDVGGMEQHDGSAPAALPATGQRDDVVDHVAGPAIGIAGLAGFRRAGADEAALFVTRLSKTGGTSRGAGVANVLGADAGVAAAGDARAAVLLGDGRRGQGEEWILV